MMFASAIVLTAGKGKRFGSRIPKPFVRLGGLPVVEHCLRTFAALTCVRQIVIAVSPGGERYLRPVVGRLKAVDVRVVAGGARRQDSVRNALAAVDHRARIVLVHDGARPFVSAKTVSAVVRAAQRDGAAIPAVPVKATIKEVKGSRVYRTLQRSDLWEVQTPQAFRREIIAGAYRSCGRFPVTDDASLVERMGCKVAVVVGEYTNIKLTTPDDLVIAEALLKRKKPG